MSAAATWARPSTSTAAALDLIFPHHENEIAQSEARQRQAAREVLDARRLPGPRRREDVQVARATWCGCATRSSKVDAEALRCFFLSTHYRHPLDFSDKSLADAEPRMEYFYETLRKVDERVGGQGLRPGPLHGEPERFLREFEAAMDDDFNSAGALGALSGALRRR